ncbi:MAG: serine hydrolase domain-containing protein [Bacteroidota bacterium]
MRRILLVLFLLLTIGACQRRAFVPSYAKEAPLTTQLQEIYENGHLPGLAVAIVTKDSTLFQQAFGYADVAQQVAYTPQTQQNIASLSKTFVGIVLMKAIEANKLSLETPINELLPFEVVNPYASAQPITVRHLNEVVRPH